MRGPGLAQAAQHPLEDHGVLCSGGTLAGTQGGGDEFAGEFLEDKQRQVAVVAVMVVIKGEFLLAMGGILGVVHIEDNHRGWLGVTGNELINKGPGHAVEIPGRGGIFQTREGGRTGQVTRRIQGLAIYPQLEQRIGTQGVGVVAILVTAGDLVYALGQEIPQGMLRVGGMTLIVEGLCQAVGDADLLVNAPRNSTGPKSEDRAPPSKSAQRENPSTGGKLSCSGIDLDIGDLVWLLPKRYWCNTHSIKALNEVRLFYE